MMFVVRSTAGPPIAPWLEIKTSRKTPQTVAAGTEKTDYFCVADPEAIASLRAQGWEIIELRDGWYADDAAGGVAISGHGKYWEIRETLFSVKETAGPATEADRTEAASDVVNVRRAIFGV